MDIKQYYDTDLAHASYMVISGNEAAVIDPARDPKPYYKDALDNNATIKAVIETHPHADFVSSHLEIAKQTGATIYVSKLLGALYEHTTFDEGDELKIGEVTLAPLNTPGHSPDSISIVLKDEGGYDHAVFTGDTLFIGDVGRPDLRESAGNLTAKREELARDMYHSLRSKLMKLDEDVLVYPAHGAGSLCGKDLSDDRVSHIGRELKENYALQPMDEDEFVKVLLEDQPFVPKYFGHDVEINRAGATDVQAAMDAVPRLENDRDLLKEGFLVVDTRPGDDFKDGHEPGAINIMLHEGKFETWLGSIIGPEERFYLICQTPEDMEIAISKAAKIGYEKNIEGVMTAPTIPQGISLKLDLEGFKENLDNFQVVDIRNYGEVRTTKVFEGAVNIPLPELRERAAELSTDKPLVVHCAGGYRSAAGQSIVQQVLGEDVQVYDLSTAIKEFNSEL